jgi:hypothetical protein
VESEPEPQLDAAPFPTAPAPSLIFFLTLVFKENKRFEHKLRVNELTLNEIQRTLTL